MDCFFCFVFKYSFLVKETEIEPWWLYLNVPKNDAPSKCFISKSFHTPPNNYHVNNYLHLSLDVEIDMFTLHLSSDFTVQTETFC